MQLMLPLPKRLRQVVGVGEAHDHIPDHDREGIR
jgi:hypothetical protein